MTMNPLPPQAYTKETLLKAYSWLINQSDSIKEMATTPDILVSLYLKTTRDGESALDRPSIQNFKKELKNLAGLMGELDKAPSMPSILAQTAPPPPVSPHPGPATAAGNEKISTAGSVSSSSFTSPLGRLEIPPMPVLPNLLTMNQDLHALLDLQSLSMIQEVKEEFNLSTEIEALRLLVKIGHVRSRSFLK